jgi:cytochrome c oxidase assembly factor CtaG
MQMNPVLKAVLLSWDFRMDVIIVLALAGTLFCRGWWRLRRQTRPLHAHTRHNRKQLGARWRLVSYLSGLIIVAIALMSAIDLLAGQYFFIHMIQHLLLVMIAPPLLLIANPMPFMLWGMPDAWRRKLGKGLSQLLRKNAPFRQGLRSATNPGLIWLIWVVSLIGWHDPGMYNAALRNDFIHDVEHLTFFLAAMLYWWLITGAGPRIHKQFSLPGRIVFTIAAVPPNMALGVVLSFVNNPVYTYYLTAPRLWPIEVLTDQKIGGVIMWIPGSMMYLIAALILISRLVQSDKVTR